MSMLAVAPFSIVSVRLFVVGRFPSRNWKRLPRTRRAVPVASPVECDVGRMSAGHAAERDIVIEYAEVAGQIELQANLRRTCRR